MAYQDLEAAAYYAEDAAHELARLQEEAARGTTPPVGAIGVGSIMGKVVTALDAAGHREALVETLEFHLAEVRNAKPNKAWHGGDSDD